MLVRISTLQLWTGEMVPQTTTAAQIVRADGTVEDITVAPYQHLVSVPADVEEKWTADELRAHDLARYTKFQTPKGKDRVGDRRFEMRDGHIFEVFDVVDEPPPPEPETKSEKLLRLLGDYGLTIDDIKAEVAGAE